MFGEKFVAEMKFEGYVGVEFQSAALYIGLK